MLSEGRQYLREQWWIATFPGSGDYADGARAQFAWRRVARCAGSSNESVMTKLSQTHERLIYPEWLDRRNRCGRPAGTCTGIQRPRSRRLVRQRELSHATADVVVQADGMSLLPGLINMHAHLNLVPDNAPVHAVYGRALGRGAGLPLRLQRSGLRCASGVTTVRDCGSRGRTVLDLRAAKPSGWSTGHRVLSPPVAR